MDQFGDELPVLTLWKIIEHVHGRLSAVEPPQRIEAIKEQFAKQFPEATFPWNETFVLEVWQQYNDANA